MRTCAFFTTGVLIIVFQTTLLPFFSSWFGFPDLVFVLVAFIAYRFDVMRGLFLSFTFGWMMDTVSGFYLGAFVVEYLLVFLALHALTSNSPVKESAYQVPLVGVAYFISQVVLYASVTMAVAEKIAPWSWSGLVREAIILTVATIPCFVLFNSLYEFLSKPRMTSRLVRKRGGNRFR